MFKKFFQLKQYLDCPLMKNSIHFFYNEVRICCSSAQGPVFYPNYHGEKIDWEYVYKFRKSIFEKIKNTREKNYIPQECKGCCDIPEYITQIPPEDFDNKIQRIYFQNHMSCNARCTYCNFQRHNYAYGYDVVNSVKELIENDILSKNAYIFMSGGEITISNEFEELLELLLSHINGQIEIFTSGIKYCKSIENAFVQDKCKMLLSLDSGSKETYKKIKQVDSFDSVIENLKTYINASDNAKRAITLKYIIVDGVNDNKEEIEKFLVLASNLGIQNVRLDFDYEKYRFIKNKKIPKYYFDLFNYFNEQAQKMNLNIIKYTQIQEIMNRS